MMIEGNEKCLFSNTQVFGIIFEMKKKEKETNDNRWKWKKSKMFIFKHRYLASYLKRKKVKGEKW